MQKGREVHYKSGTNKSLVPLKLNYINIAPMPSKPLGKILKKYKQQKMVTVA